MNYFVRKWKGIEHKILGFESDRYTCIECEKEFNQRNFHVASITAEGFKRLKHTCKTCANKMRAVRHKLNADPNTPPKPKDCPHCSKKNCKIVLDHDWLTGKFRNWSCINCNAKHSEKTYEEADKNNRKWYHVGEYDDK
jgi:hypothetical protein